MNLTSSRGFFFCVSAAASSATRFTVEVEGEKKSMEMIPGSEFAWLI